ncbi:MAG TPA: zinc-binding alcohol dehydrogenase family protein [Trebonia sp.]|jgi:NADPH:quinone reductase-like Zn-dependent oxidoreductase
MKAAVVTSYGEPPRYADFPLPATLGEHEMIVDVLAAGLHRVVRSRASGAHYSADGTLPFVPGIDGVGRDPGGRLRYFIQQDSTLGTMAEQTVIDTRRSVVLPDGTDPVAVAAAVNPAMSSWLALRYRAGFTAGQDVLILGATGSAGRMAVAAAQMQGARRIIAAGRDPQRLAALTEFGAGTRVSLAGSPDEAAERLASAAADVDVVLDYLWGEPAAAAITALITARPDRGKPLSWVQIGSVAGATAAVPSAALRSAKFRITGSGIGSVTAPEIIAELPGLAAAITSGSLRAEARPVPLADVESAWTEPADTIRRTVITPRS